MSPVQTVRSGGTPARSAASSIARVVAYSWRGGLRSSMLTDAGQMLLAAILLTAILIVVFPPPVRSGLPSVPPAVHLAGVTFLALAAVQVR